MSHRHLSRRLVIAAGAAVAMSAGAAPALAATSPHTTPTLQSETRQAESTPLGAAIVRQDDLTRLDSSLDRAATETFAANLKAREKATGVVMAVAPRSTGDQVEIKREWVKGMRYEIASDRLLLDYLHGPMTGHAANRLRTTGLNDANDGDGLIGWAFNALWGTPGPLPRS